MKLKLTDRMVTVDLERYEDMDDLPTKGRMSASKGGTVNLKMATLKRVEGRRNRFVKQGLLK